MKVLLTLILSTVVSAAAWQNCNQPGWVNGSTICFRMVHKPKSFLAAKEECKRFGGSLLTLDKVEEVMETLGSSMVGNGANYRIDGWLNEVWKEQDNQTLTLKAVPSIQTLVLNVEDGRVSGSWSARSRLSFVCQKLQETGPTCSDHAHITENSLSPFGCGEMNFLWYLVKSDQGPYDLDPYPSKPAICTCNSFKTKFPTPYVEKYGRKLMINHFLNPKKIFFFQAEYGWKVYHNNQWQFVFELNKDSEPVLSFGIFIFINKNTQFATDAKPLDPLKRISFDPVTMNFTYTVETTLPKDLDLRGPPVFYEPLGKIFFGGLTNSFFLATNGTHYVNWEKIPSPFGSFDMTKRDLNFYCCRSTIFVVTCSPFNGRCSMNTLDAAKYASLNLNPWGQWTTLPFFGTFDWKGYFCYQDEVKFYSGSTILQINPKPNVEPVKEPVRSKSPTWVIRPTTFPLPAEFVECADH